MSVYGAASSAFRSSAQCFEHLPVSAVTGLLTRGVCRRVSGEAELMFEARDCDDRPPFVVLALGVRIKLTSSFIPVSRVIVCRRG